MTQKERARLLLSTLRKSKLTANELIDKIWHKDPDRKDRHYKFYLHLNKLFAPLEKLGFLTVCDKKKGNFIFCPKISNPYA